MTNWITSDLHLFHVNILKFCPETRPFSNIGDMNQSFKAALEVNAKAGDRVFILGDVSFGSKANTEKIFQDCKAEIIVIQGNHDEPKMLSGFNRVLDYHEEIIQMTRVCMFHFPVESWHKKEKGSIHVHGHMHGKGQDLPRRKDIGVDATGRWLINLDELVLETVKTPYDPVR